MNKPPQSPLVAPPSGEPDPDAPPSEEEIRAGETLRRALEDPRLPSEAAELARAAALAHGPRLLDAGQHRVILEKALSRAPLVPAQSSTRGRVVRIAFGAGSALALAAGVALLVSSLRSPDASELSASEALPNREAPFRARSTQPLFATPFEGPIAAVAKSRPSSGSGHIDRIAMARASDFRENEFSRWGTR